MNTFDPLMMLGELDRPVTPAPGFAEALLSSCLAELGAPAAPRLRLSLPVRRRRLRIAVIAAIVVLAVAGVATATYLAVRGPAAGPPRQSQLTVITSVGGGMRVAALAVVGPGGRLRTVWRCPEPVFCGELTSASWSPDGKKLALTLDEIGGLSGYVGLHIINLRTGSDRHIPFLPVAHISRPQPRRVLSKLHDLAVKQLGCYLPDQVAWSPDSSHLAYGCAFPDSVTGLPRSRIFVLAAAGGKATRARTGTSNAYWPAWSPDGRQLAFSTQADPTVVFRTGTTTPVRRFVSSVYVVGVHGGQPQLVARRASTPSWSPDGRTLAFASSLPGCRGTRLATPGAAASLCRLIGPAGRAAWSPDGTQLAIGTSRGVYVVGADGSGRHRATADSGLGVLGGGRPSWQPGPAVIRHTARRPQGDL